MSLVECWNHYFGDRQACNNSAAYLFLPHIASILTSSGFGAGCYPPSEQEGDYVITLKKNQPSLYARVEELFKQAIRQGFSGFTHTAYSPLEREQSRSLRNPRSQPC